MLRSVIRNLQSTRRDFSAYWIYPAVTRMQAGASPAPEGALSAGLAALEFCRFFKD
jgi:hypothetical protein